MSKRRDSCSRGFRKIVGLPDRLWANLDCRAVGCYPPEFLDFFVGNCDATGGPIVPAMKRANPAASVSNSVDHDVRTGRSATCSCTLVIFIRRIRNVQREMEAALRISTINLVGSLPAFSCRLL